MTSLDPKLKDFYSSLNIFLQDKSYIQGYTPSQADVSVFNEIQQPPIATEFPHLARWYTHIFSYKQEHSVLPGERGKSACSYVPLSTFQTEEKEEEEEEEDIDLFGSSDEEDEEAERMKAERVKMYNEKKASKPKTIAKSLVTLDVKPWDDETDMVALEEGVRAIEMDGLVWGASKLVLVGYGIRKLQITLVVEDDKVSIEELQEQIAELEDYVQSSDVVAMQKL
ncbi:translation elongation factor 1 subunit beta [Pneumocystis jirovecii RU7]|uniref:Elongation factor 1-beta n=1 Tax=Pneumocystis jirovecii (strain RU7) TaxID=1408657 RepID=A0A0W4ZMH8_PNEJ7|nr:translation elongation factor 1 subunit beta [Pneumocystis jirovecii RU7]KTW29510.1 hypothetical protein T551_02126 [Pneumocystis jirovecii RU7]